MLSFISFNVKLDRVIKTRFILSYAPFTHIQK